MENLMLRENLSELGNNLSEFEKQTADITGRYAAAIGKGIVAGLAGTAAITLSQMVEMKLTGRPKSEAPAEVANKALGVQPVNQEKKEELSTKIHWGYGAAWGAVRGILKEAGMPAWAATATHFAGVYGTALVMLPATKVAPPVKEWGGKAIAIDALHHGIYAAVTGLVYDAIDVKDDRFDRLLASFYDQELELDAPEFEVLEIETDYYEEPQYYDGADSDLGI
jgi:hypothetical protein